MNFTLEQIARAVKGNLCSGDQNSLVESFTLALNSNTLPHSLYFMFSMSFDEPKLLLQAIKHQVSCLLVRSARRLALDKWADAKIGVIEVSHMEGALFALAKYNRLNLQIPVIEVIGSSGKTTTKEMVGAVLGQKNDVFFSHNNYNSPFQVAAYLLSLHRGYWAAVLEVGMLAPGVIRTSSQMVRPDIGIVTSIHRAHLGRLGTIENIVKAKAELLSYLPDNGLLVLNGEDELCRKPPFSNYKGKIIYYGFSGDHDISATDIRTEGIHTTFNVQSREYKIFNCSINAFGRYNVGNALAAIAVGAHLGLSPEEAAKGLASYKPLEGRQQIYKIKNNITLVNDNFNANPDSTRMLLEELSSFSKERPVLLVLGDMENPDADPDYAREVHFQVGIQVSKLKLHRLIAIGKWAEEYARGAVEAGVPRDLTSYFRKVEEAEQCFLSSLIPGCVVVLKAPFMQGSEV